MIFFLFSIEEIYRIVSQKQLQDVVDGKINPNSEGINIKPTNNENAQKQSCNC